MTIFQKKSTSKYVNVIWGHGDFPKHKKTSDAVICDYEERRRINGLLLALWAELQYVTDMADKSV